MLAFRSGNVLFDLGEVYLLIMFITAILSWFPYDPNSPLNPIRRVCNMLVDPLVRQFRRFIPPIGMLDISFLVAMLAVYIVTVNILGRIPI